MKTLIKNGTVVNAELSVKADVLCIDGTIAQIDKNISPPKETKIIDASDQIVMPGWY